MALTREQSWYLEGAKKASYLFADGREWYVCPLCMTGFSPQALTLKLLSKEHVPPKSNGGKEMVLTCTECNNFGGAASDSHARAMEDLLDFGRGTLSRTVPINLRIAGLNVRASLRAEGESVHVETHSKANSPRTSALLKDAMNRAVEEGSWGDTSFDIDFRRSFRWRPALVSWLRAGYLAAFAGLGYRYIGRRSLDIVREQIAAPESDIIGYFSATTSEAPLSERTILLVDDPAWVKSVFVQMGQHIVFLPPLGSDENFYERFSTEARARKQTGHLSGKLVPWPRRSTYLLDS